MNLISKLVLVASNVLLLVARVGSVFSTLVITVLARSDFAMDQVGVDMSNQQENPLYHNDFINHFTAALSKLSQEIGTNSIFLAALLFVHLLAVTTHAILRSTKYPDSSLTERLLHLVSSIWLPLPLLTSGQVDMGAESTSMAVLRKGKLYIFEPLVKGCVLGGWGDVSDPTASHRSYMQMFDIMIHFL